MVREGGDKTSRAGDEESEEEETGEADPSLRLPSRDLFANVMQHSGSFLSVSLDFGCVFLSLSESQKKTVRLHCGRYHERNGTT